MLTTNVKTASDLMSIALKAEREAVRRYLRLVDAMRHHGNREAAALFERMAREEQEHERLLEEWAQLEGIELRTDIGPVSWEDPQVPTVYDNEAVDPARCTPYRALAFAVHNEERAFHFYAHVAANADDEAVRDYAETLAQEELGHAALLRAMRRQAWHAEQEAAREEPDVDPGAIHTLADLLTVAAGMEHCLAENMDALLDAYPALQPVKTALQNELADIQARLKTAGQAGAAIAAVLDSIREYERKTAAKNDDANASLQRLYSDSDRCFYFYDAVVTHSKNEDVMLAAQQLSESALERVGALQGMRAQSHPA